MIRTISIDRAIGFYPSIIQFGILFLSNDRSLNTSETNDLIERLQKVSESTSFTEKLTFWLNNKICVTHIWLCDTSSLVEGENREEVRYKTELGPPSPDIVFALYPSTPLEVVEINLKNIATGLEYTGSFDRYKSDYLALLEENRSSAFLLNRIKNDLNEVKKKFSDHNNRLVFLDIQEHQWSDSFRDGTDSLNLNDYKIWNRSETSISNLSAVSRYAQGPYLFHFVDLPEDVIGAAKGYLNCQIVPFLEGLVVQYSNKSNLETKAIPNYSNTDYNPPNSTRLDSNNYKPLTKPSMKIETDRLELIIQTLDHIFVDSRYEFRTRWNNGSLGSPLCKLYVYYQSLTNTWRDNRTLVLDPYALESEIKDNFLSVNEQQKSNYIKLLKHKLSYLKEEEQKTIKSLEELKIDIENGLVDRDQIIDYNHSRVSTFVYYMEDTLRMADRVERIINENIEVFCSEPINQELNTALLNSEPCVKLQWNGAADTLYDIFRQLKNHHLPNGSALVEDSYDNIAIFIKQVFTGFDGVETSTIRGELTKNKRPKKSFNRIDLDLTEPD
ncbi:hypothetical protein [Spirosoma luteum]|uniref:hypothetical protein n=1 Tax=Spirosoma luteum TaxID=431553 RepID=UPI00036D95AE|nr:hypothetical protein [Spirosoma luteum]